MSTSDDNNDDIADKDCNSNNISNILTTKIIIITGYSKS